MTTRTTPSTPPPDPLEAAYSVLAFTMNRSVIDHMLRSARRFGGDYERLILWGTLAHLNVAHLMPPGSLPSTLLDGAGSVPDAAARLRPVRASDLAQITGIPRETARRKLAALERDGWVLRTDAGWLLDVARVDPELRGFTLESIRRFLQAARAMQAAIDDVARGASGTRDAAPTAHPEPSDPRDGVGLPGDAPRRVSGSRTGRSAGSPTTARTTAAPRSRPPRRRG